MKPAFYTGASGLIAFQNSINNVGNNLANTNTVGYKAQGMSFEDLLYQDMYVNTTPTPLTGNGVRAIGTGLQIQQSSFKSAEGGYNFAIANDNGDGNGFFAVEGPDGEISYTRNGAFTVDVESGELVTMDGRFVLDNRGEHIEVDLPEYKSSKKNKKVEEAQDLTREIGVYMFDNPSQLEPISETRYRATAASGQAVAADEEIGYQIYKDMLEQSGVSVQEEMANMILAQRGFQLSAKVLQTADTIEDTINTLRR